MLTESELKEFREILSQERSELLARMKTLDQRLAGDDHFNGAEDLGDSANQVLGKEEALFERNQTAERLQAVERALRRIDEGRYGISNVSGKPIPKARLRAMPTATRLVDE